MGVLGLGLIIIREGVAQGALLGCSLQGSTLPCVADQKVKLLLVCYQPPSQPFSVSLFPSALLPWEKAGISYLLLVSTIGYPYLSLIFKRDDRFSDFERLQRARLCKERQERRRGPTGICEVPSKPGGDNRMTGCFTLSV